MRWNPYQLPKASPSPPSPSAPRRPTSGSGAVRGGVVALERAAQRCRPRTCSATSPSVVTGPDDYLLGEEKGLLEAIEGRLPSPLVPALPRRSVHGHAGGVGQDRPGGANRPTPPSSTTSRLSPTSHILAHGPEWFRAGNARLARQHASRCGDVVHEGVAELPMGTPLAVLVHGVGEGHGGQEGQGRLSRVSNAPIPTRCSTPR